MTEFTKVYERFLGKITDDMYLEWTPEDTMKDCRNILIDAIPAFEFPRKSLAYDKDAFEADLTAEEINILAVLMMNVWLQRQMTSVENIRMKYSGSDFKMTSQANHLAKLIDLKLESEKQDRHLQRLYRRRKIDDKGNVSSNWSVLISKSALE